MTTGILCYKEVWVAVNAECQLPETRAVTLNNAIQNRSTYALQNVPGNPLFIL